MGGIVIKFDFDIKYVKKKNIVADALSRRPLANAISYLAYFFDG